MAKVKIVCIGDSLTEGYAIGPETEWCHLLQLDLNITIINSGISGDTTAGMLARFQQMVVAHQPDYVIIMGGTNDLAYNLPNELILSNLLAMTRHARHHQIAAIIGIPTPFFDLLSGASPQSQAPDSFGKRIQDYQHAVRQFAIEEELPFIEFSSGMTPALFLPDGVHPNEAGHQHMARQAKAVLKNILKE